MRAVSPDPQDYFFVLGAKEETPIQHRAARMSRANSQAILPIMKLCVVEKLEQVQDDYFDPVTTLKGEPCPTNGSFG